MRGWRRSTMASRSERTRSLCTIDQGAEGDLIFDSGSFGHRLEIAEPAGGLVLPNHSTTDAGNSHRTGSRSNRISAGILYVALAGPPLLFGSREPTTIALWCALLGAGLVLASPKRLQKGHLFLLGGPRLCCVVFWLRPSRTTFRPSLDCPIQSCMGQSVGSPGTAACSIGIDCKGTAFLRAWAAAGKHACAHSWLDCRS